MLELASHYQSDAVEQFNPGHNLDPDNISDEGYHQMVLELKGGKTAILPYFLKVMDSVQLGPGKRITEFSFHDNTGKKVDERVASFEDGKLSNSLAFYPFVDGTAVKWGFIADRAPLHLA